MTRKFGRSGLAALEFGLLAPTFLLVVMALLDAAYAYSVQLRVTNATTAAGMYAYSHAGIIQDSATLATYLSDVAAVATNSESFPIAPAVTTLYNNQSAKNADLSNAYCVYNEPPVTWVLSTQGASCGAAAPNTTAGIYVTVDVTVNFVPFFPTDRFFLGGIPIADSVIVRLQ